MRAVRYPRYGGPEVLRVDDIPAPVAGQGELLVRVLGSSVNPIDWKLASGALRFLVPVSRPAVPGFDLVGEVLALGAGVSGFQPGQKVVARVDSNPGGASAEQAVVNAAVAVALPESVSVEHAAVLPLAGMTALQALRDDCGMKLHGERKRVLIVGASGGVGHYGLQLAHLAGAHVTAVCSTRNVELVTELGADEVIDYRQQSDFRSCSPYDIILDCAAKAPWSSFEEVLTPRGVLAQPTISGSWLPRMLVTNLFSGRSIKATMLKTNAPDLKLLLDLMAQGKLRSVVGARYPFTELAEAWALNQRGGSQGKILIEYPS